MYDRKSVVAYRQYTRLLSSHNCSALQLGIISAELRFSIAPIIEINIFSLPCPEEYGLFTCCLR